MKQNIGLYPGTFDPVHNGHIAFANEAARVCKLDKIIFLPELQPRGKQHVTYIDHRLALIQHAINDLTHFGVATLTSQQFTVPQTLPELQAMFTGATLTLLIGSDVARSLEYWPAIEVLLKNVTLAIGIRSSDSCAEIDAIMKHLQSHYKIDIKYACIVTPDAHVASSQVRSNVTDVSHVHPAVARYIRQQNLYK